MAVQAKCVFVLLLLLPSAVAAPDAQLPRPLVLDLLIVYKCVY